MRDRGHRATRNDMHRIAAALNDRGALLPTLSVDRATDIIHAIAANENPYLRLTDEGTWTQGQYTDMIKRTLTALLLDPTAQDPPAQVPPA
jgi:hypothetical protein